ncbi:MAG: hypothetical protein AB1646_26175 [Thermodesulfobacteriota bacterium]
MDLEDVTIRLMPRRYRVEALFVFHNTGQTTTEWVGFPRRGDHTDFLRFDVWVDGKSAPLLECSDWPSAESTVDSIHREKPEVRQRYRMSLLLLKVTFPGHRATILRAIYEARYGGLAASYDLGGEPCWKGPIGMAAVTVIRSGIGGIGPLELSFDSVAKWRRTGTKDAVRMETTDYLPRIWPESVTVLMQAH